MAGRLLAISDLHVGYPENRAYADALSPGGPGDWLIVAGDVGEVFADVGFVLASLASRFAKVIWTPGNHELWTLPSDPVALRGAARYEALVKVCRRFGVVTPEDEFPVWDGPDGPVTVAPLFTLYDYSFRADGVPARDDPAAAVLAAIDEAVGDDGRSAALAAARKAGIKPVDEGRLHADPYPSAAAWCRDLVAAAEGRLAAVTGPVVLVSHWPLVRGPVDELRHQAFAPWCGTTLTADWHARHKTVAAVYGHLHIPRTTRHDGVRFEEVSVGYPREWQRRGTAPPSPRVILEGALPAPASHPRLAISPHGTIFSLLDDELEPEAPGLLGSARRSISEKTPHGQTPQGAHTGARVPEGVPGIEPSIPGLAGPVAKEGVVAVHEIRIDKSKTLSEEPGTGHNRWHPDIPPLVRCEPGDEVVLETRDALDGQAAPGIGADALATPNLDVVHPLTGPVYVEGAEPGDLLAVEILDIEPDDYGFTVQLPGFGFLRDEFPEPFKVEWDIADGWATSADLPQVRIPGSPFMGTIGLAPGRELLAATIAREQALLERGGLVLPPSPAGAVPADPRIAAEALRTIPPREQAGNVDIKQLGQGATLLIAVSAPGGMFSAGDAHFAQGDCETCGTAIEMRATLHVRFGLRKGEAAARNIRDLRFTRQDYYLPPEFAAPRRFFATTGISVTRDGVNHSEDITLAARNALLNMIDHLGERGWTRQQAYAICSVAVDLKISQLVDAPNMLVSAFLPEDIFAG